MDFSYIDGEKIWIFSASIFSEMSNKNKISLKIDKKNKNITNYINNWMDEGFEKNIIINIKNKYILIKNCIPYNLTIDISGYAQNLKLWCSEPYIKDISRKVKINKILKEK